MELLNRYDVVIAGIRILIAEKNDHPFPEAAHKVGESSVEMASHYFTDVLGLGEILATEIPKFGLRFFLSHDGNRDIAARPECGPSHFLYVPSFQIDRGRFENALARRARALSRFASAADSVISSASPGPPRASTFAADGWWTPPGGPACSRRSSA